MSDIIYRLKMIPRGEYTIQWEYSCNNYPSQPVSYFQSFYGDTEDSLKYFDAPATENECKLAVFAYLCMFQSYQSAFCFESIERERARDLLTYFRSLLNPFGACISDEAIMVFWYHLHEFGIVGKAFNRTLEHFQEKYTKDSSEE